MGDRKSNLRLIREEEEDVTIEMEDDMILWMKTMKKETCLTFSVMSNRKKKKHCPSQNRNN